MSTPKWTPEMEAGCLAAGRAARTEPETVDGFRAQIESMMALFREAAAAQESERAAADAVVAELRAALATSGAARIAAEERARVLGEALRSVVDNAFTIHGVSVGWSDELSDALRSAFALLSSLPAAPSQVTDDEDACEVCSRGPSDTVTLYSDGKNTVCAECAAREYLSSGAPAEEPNLTAAAEEAMRAALRLKNGTGDLADDKALADAALDRLRIAASAPAEEPTK